MNMRGFSSVSSSPGLARRLSVPMILALACGAAVPAAAQPTATGAVLPQLTRMNLTVSVDYEAERVVGTSTLTLKNTSNIVLSRVPLILNRVMRVSDVTTGDGRKLTFRQRVTSFEDFEIFQVNAIEVDLTAPVPAGESVRLVVSFEGPLVGYTETGMSYVRDHISRDFTMLREDACAFPMVGVPSIERNRAAPRAPFEFAVSMTV
ncbi:MAG: hypothetical protein ACWGON_00130, partial [Gemmatimonadota bacterium]